MSERPPLLGRDRIVELLSHANPDSLDGALRGARKEAGLSIAEAARRAGTSRAAIHAYESGRISPSLVTASRILAVYGFELSVRPAGAPQPDPVDDAASLAPVGAPAERRLARQWVDAAPALEAHPPGGYAPAGAARPRLE
ncbi:MAG: helix-turn-helix transcriptional regulator [Acidimicrobiales bacterium]